jgi:hypothetical protein
MFNVNLYNFLLYMALWYILIRENPRKSVVNIYFPLWSLCPEPVWDLIRDGNILGCGSAAM